MTKSEHQQRIEQFMRLAGQNLPISPEIPTKEVRLLRAKLILEEALETIHALGILVTRNVTHDDGSIVDYPLYLKSECLRFSDIGPVSLEEIADGCADLSVVTIGTLSACGIHDKELLEIVDQSNLAKFGIPKCPECRIEMQHLNETIGDAFEKGLYECPHFDCDKQAFGPYKRSDGKWIKSPDWKKPDIRKLLENQQ